MKKIMFNEQYGLTKAVLGRRKTLTRRNTPKELPDAIRCGYDRLEIIGGKELRCWKDETHSFIKFNLPYKVGEIVAVAQSYKDCGYNSNMIQSGSIKGRFGDFFICELAGWTNKMFVYGELMPHQIRITNVWIERLQDISDEDCIKEGILFNEKGVMKYGFKISETTSKWYTTPQNAYASLIDKVSGKGTWERNPLVLCYEFELIK